MPLHRLFTVILADGWMGEDSGGLSGEPSTSAKDFTEWSVLYFGTEY